MCCDEIRKCGALRLGFFYFSGRTVDINGVSFDILYKDGNSNIIRFSINVNKLLSIIIK